MPLSEDIAYLHTLIHSGRTEYPHFQFWDIMHRKQLLVLAKGRPLFIIIYLINYLFNVCLKLFRLPMH